jgi:hypothetical protein
LLLIFAARRSSYAATAHIAEIMMVRKIGGSINKTQKNIGKSTADTMILFFILPPPICFIMQHVLGAIFFSSYRQGIRPVFH